MKLIVIFLFIIFVQQIHSFLCSGYCKTNSCFDITSSGCQTACPTNWVLSGSTCLPDTTLNYAQLATSTDIGGSIQVTPSNTSNCGVYNYFGQIKCNDDFQLSLAAGLGVPHYSF